VSEQQSEPILLYLVAKSLFPKRAWHDSDKENKVTISKVIAKYEDKEYEEPTIYVVPDKPFTQPFGLFLASEKASPKVLSMWPGGFITSVRTDWTIYVFNAPQIANWFVYADEGVNLGIVLAALAYGAVPIVPDFFKEDLGDCGIYYQAELNYPRWKTSVANIFDAIRKVMLDGKEPLYRAKLEACRKKFSEREFEL
jgi:hypothetical protein